MTRGVTRFTGLAAWWVQRISAVYLLLFILFVLAALSLQPPRAYAEWRSWVADPRIALGLLTFFGALLSHMWVGLRDVLLDYARPAGLRRFLLVALAGGLLGMALWVLWILLQARS